MGSADVGVSQVGGGRFQKAAVVEYSPVLKEYPSCVLQVEGEARMSAGFAEGLLPLYLREGVVDGTA